MNNVEKFYPSNAADLADNVLELAKNQYDQVLVIGWRKDNGALDARVTQGLADGAQILWLLDLFKTNLLAGACEED